ncbi:rab11 family-interacting protein 1 isoform X1 [Mastacembelus armatus]|uniref:RAB11 family interacting protein 5a (class I) n=1 Tax=Mastacembelus armatus TaxID=205130 RepID=A0A3Q3KT05_9TELE|nr:rab11 family-interacting protein 5 isoform X1 [Mastacembelus armatus]
MSSLKVEEDQKWVPTHVQVTVLRGRGLRGKGKHGTSDVYTIIQLGKEKYSTCVVEKTTEPEWKEECSFELQPGVLESGCPAGSNELILTVMHRALMGLDVFLGQAVIQLDKVFHESRCVKNQWYRLNSKMGKKEKERGEIQVTIQFTRNNLTASMYDLVMKDKSAFTFSKLKERMRGKRRASDEDSSSAVLPSGYGSLYRMRQRLPSDGGGEEDYEDDEGGEARRSKMRTFFLRGKLRKSSDTRSSTSLGSESSESSSRGGSLSPTAGISVVVSDLSNSPSNSSNLTVDNSPEHTANTSPRSASLKCEFGDELGEITIAVPQPTLCVNGSHAYKVHPPDPGSGKANTLGVGVLQKSLPLSMSLQNLSPQPSTDLPKGPVGDGRRWSFDKPGEEEKAAIVAALEQSGHMLDEEENHLGQAAPPKAVSTTESESQGKKQRRHLFSPGRSESAGKGHSQSKDESEQAPVAAEEKHKGWFGSKDSHTKPSLEVSPKLEPSTDPFKPPLSSSHHSLGAPVDPASVGSPLHHTNPFCHSQATPPPISPCNPFFSVLQQNPFFEDMLTMPLLKPSLPPLPYLSSSRPSITQLFPQASNTNPTLTHNNPAPDGLIMGTDAESDVMVSEGEKPLSKKVLNPFISSQELEPASEWDESFEAFAAGRLQSLEDQTTDCKTKQNTPSAHPVEHSNNKGTLLHIAGAERNTNLNDTLHPKPFTEFVFEAQKSISGVTSSGKHHHDTFAQFLETIPEHRSFESDGLPLDTYEDSPNACTEPNNTTSTNDLTDTNTHRVLSHASSVPLSSSSPDPGSSGLGSSAEEEFLSCLSSSSDKFSASSSEEAEAQNILSFEKSPESAEVKNLKASESEEDITDRSNDLSLDDVTQQTVIQRQTPDQKVDLDDSERSLAPQSELKPKSEVFSQFEDENKEKGLGELNGLIVDFFKEDNDSFVNNNTHMMMPANPDEELCSPNPSLYIITSSPGVRQSLSDSPFESTSLGVQDANQHSPVPFGAFGELLITSPGKDPDNTQVSDQRASSFLQSLYVSADSQGYQTCESQPSSKSSCVSEPNEMLQSANSTLCSELSEMQSAAAAVLCVEDATNACSPLNGSKDKMAAPEPSFTKGDGFQVLTAAPTDSNMHCNPRKLSKRGVESQHYVLDYEFSKHPQAQSALLQRSQSEGTLTPSFDELSLPSFGSDPGAIPASSMAQPGPDIPCLSSFAPSLTPKVSSSPLVLGYLPPLANASARSPPSTAQAAAPKRMPQETQQQQQAADQQNSPHLVKPLTTATTAEEKRAEGRSVLATSLEKFKSTIHPGRSSQPSEQETDRKKSLTEGAGSYYHLTHSELVSLLVKRETELERQKVEFERQKILLAKREVELKKLKPQIKDLEDYIDTLLVRIMEQKPTLLQVHSKFK